MKRSDLNHLRRLVSWVRCEIGQDPAEMQKTMINIADKLSVESHEISDEGKARMVESYRRAAAVPQYVRDAIKALDRYARPPGQDGGSEKRRAAVETRADAGSDGGHGRACAPTSINLQSMIGWMRRRQGWPQVIVSGRMAGDIADMLSLHGGDTLYLGCARMGLAGASDEEVLNYVRLSTQKAASGHNVLPLDTGSGHSAQEVIQRAVNAIERPEGLTDTRWEYVKAGIRLLVAEVNRVASDSALKEVGHE
ncbi:MAG: hypothetical protein KUL86_10895 [Castellaniella sp.]|nr:hypothetical protein [Castellaniella sp.]